MGGAPRAPEAEAEATILGPKPVFRSLQPCLPEARGLLRHPVRDSSITGGLGH